MADGRACTAASSSETEDFHRQNSHQRGMKRSRSGFTSTESAEPEIKRSTFKLQPAILIHGQTKSQAKASDQSVLERTSNKCKFLQPSKLQAPPSFRNEQNTHSSGDLPAQTGTSTFVSSCNPFLMVNKEGENSQNETDSVADDEKKDTEESTSEEVLNRSNGSSDSPAKKETKDEKEKAGITSTFSLKPAASTSGSGFVFGQNFAERAKVKAGAEGAEHADASTFSSPKKPTFSSPTKEKSADFADGQKDPSDTPPKTTKAVLKGLEENAAAHYAATQNRTVTPEVEVFTGEEDEKNVLQIQCKLYQFNADTQVWMERGMGNLHLNDHKFTGVDGHFQSRLVMRVHGSMRLVLNTKIWAQMTVDRASKKSIRVSAQTGDGDIGVFLISTTINDAEQIYRALEYRILHQKQWDDENKDSEEAKESDAVSKNKHSNAESSDCKTETDANEAPNTTSSPPADAANDDTTDEACQQKSPVTKDNNNDDDSKTNTSDTSKANTSSSCTSNGDSND